MTAEPTDARAPMTLEQAVAGLPERMGVVLREASPERVVASMPVEGNTQLYGILHGGASCVLAESVASIGAALHAGPDRIVVGIEINATHHRSARSGLVTALATPVHRGATVATYEVVITDESGQRLCTARVTCLIRSSTPQRHAAG